MLDSVLYGMVVSSAPIILCVLGGNFAQNVNVLNISLEGMLTAGAFVSVLIAMFTGNVLIAVVGAIVVSLVMGLVFSYFSISRAGNPIVAGLALNLIAASGTAFILKFMELPNLNANAVVDVASRQIRIPIIDSLPILGPIFSGHVITTWIAYISIGVMSVVFYRTKFGMYVRVVGENEEAARSVGININRIKYIAILIGAFMCALAGVNLALERLALYTNNMSAGIGFIAIAAIYCGRGRPVATSMYAILFGLSQSLAMNMNVSAGPASGLFNTIPYFMIVVILGAVSIVQRKNVRSRELTW